MKHYLSRQSSLHKSLLPGTSVVSSLADLGGNRKIFPADIHVNKSLPSQLFSKTNQGKKVRTFEKKRIPFRREPE